LRCVVRKLDNVTPTIVGLVVLFPDTLLIKNSMEPFLRCDTKHFATGEEQRKRRSLLVCPGSPDWLDDGLDSTTRVERLHGSVSLPAVYSIGCYWLDWH
jgi:hypothetical protein